MPNIICFGDSITRGENDHKAGGWVDRLKTRAIEHFITTNTAEICVFNLGIGGETTEGLMSRFRQELQPRLSTEEQNIVTLGYGANDVVDNGDGFKTALSTYIHRLKTCISFAIDNDIKPVLVNVLSVSDGIDGKLNELGKRRKNTDIKLFNEQLELLAKEHGIVLIDVASAFEDNKEHFLSEDGVHPNENGHQVIFQTVFSALKKMGLFSNPE